MLGVEAEGARLHSFWRRDDGPIWPLRVLFTSGLRPSIGWPFDVSQTEWDSGDYRGVAPVVLVQERIHGAKTEEAKGAAMSLSILTVPWPVVVGWVGAVVVVVMLLVLAGCANYRTGPQASASELLTRTPKYLLGIIEFDDQGWFRDREAAARVLHAIEQEVGPGWAGPYQQNWRARIDWKRRS